MFRERPAARWLAGIAAVGVAAALAGCGEADNPAAPAATGTFGVSVTAAGDSIDVDDLAVVVDGGAEQAIAPGAPLTLGGLPVGDHTVTLAGLAPNCTVGGANPRVVSVTDGETAAAAFAVTCRPALRNQIVFTTRRDGREELYVMNADGTGAMNLTNHPVIDQHGAISPDGTRTAFTSSRDGGDYEIYVMNHDGSDPTRITDVAGNNRRAGIWGRPGPPPGPTRPTGYTPPESPETKGPGNQRLPGPNW